MRTRGVADLVFSRLEYPALRCDLASHIFADGLRFARIPFVTDISMHEFLDATET